MKQLLFSVTAKDCEWDYTRGSGKGGQKKNKTSSAVRCSHLKSKAVGEAEDSRSQVENKKTAFRRMVETPEFKMWIKIEVSRKLGREKIIQRKVEEAMEITNLKLEIKDEKGKWKKVGFSEELDKGEQEIE